MWVFFFSFFPRSYWIDSLTPLKVFLLLWWYASTDESGLIWATMLVLQHRRRCMDRNLTFFSAIGLLPRSYNCRFADIHREGKGQLLITSIKWRSSGRVRGEDRILPFTLWKNTVQGFCQETCWQAVKTNSCIIDHDSCLQRRKHFIQLFMVCVCCQRSRHAAQNTH